MLDALEEAEHRGVEIVPSARELVADIPVSRWAVVTSGSPAVACLRLRLGQIPEPPLLITGADVRQGKPAPESYLRAAEVLGHPPSDCVVTVLAVRGTHRDVRTTIIHTSRLNPEEAQAALWAGPVRWLVRLRGVGLGRRPE